MEYIEQLILQYHNGIAGQELSSRIIDLCWKSNDFLDGYLFFLQNRDVTPVDFYVLLTALNGNNCARHSMELLELASKGKKHKGVVIGCWDHDSLNQLYRDLKSWGQIILLETQSIMQMLQPKQIEHRIGLTENKKESEKELYLAYLKRSLIFSRWNYSKGDISYDEVKQLFSEVAGLFEKYSQFELMRTWLYEARMEGNIDRAKTLAEKAHRIAVEFGFTRYKTLAQDELQRRFASSVKKDSAKIRPDQEKNKIRFQETVTRVFGPSERHTEEQALLIGFLSKLEPVKVTPSFLLRLEKNSKALIEKLRKPRQSNQKSISEISFSEIQATWEAYLLMQYYLNLIVYEYKFNDSQLFDQAGALSWPRSFRRLYLSEVFEVTQSNVAEFVGTLRTDQFVEEALIKKFSESLKRYFDLRASYRKKRLTAAKVRRTV